VQGRTENAVLEFAKQHEPDVQVTIAKPGMIEGHGHPKSVLGTAVLSFIDDVPWIHVSEIAAGLVDQCVNGITKEPLWSKDLLEIGTRFLREEN
jgi:hypothetical protein